jgi:hypothetical protein
LSQTKTQRLVVLSPEMSTRYTVIREASGPELGRSLQEISLLKAPPPAPTLEALPFGHREMEDPEMAMDMLRQLAGSPLPAMFRTPTEIDQIKLLRAAGLVIALTPASSDPQTPSGNGDAAQVFAITDKGREELDRFCFPSDLPPMPRARAPWWKTMLRARGHSRRGK